MKIGKLLGLILAVLFFSMIQVQAETWTAGPALIPGEKSKFYESTELRFRTSVAKIPVYKGKNTVFQERFNEKNEKERKPLPSGTSWRKDKKKRGRLASLARG